MRQRAPASTLFPTFDIVPCIMIGFAIYVRLLSVSFYNLLQCFQQLFIFMSLLHCYPIPPCFKSTVICTVSDQDPVLQKFFKQIDFTIYKNEIASEETKSIFNISNCFSISIRSICIIRRIFFYPVFHQAPLCPPPGRSPTHSTAGASSPYSPTIFHQMSTPYPNLIPGIAYVFVKARSKNKWG